MQATEFLRKTLLISTLAALPLARTSFAGAVPVDPKTLVTATMDGGTAKTGNTWYEQGANSTNLTSGLKLGTVAGQGDPLSLYQLRPADGNNVLMLDSATKNGTITFSFPTHLTGFSLAASSGNGTGTLIPTLHFTDNTTSTMGGLTVGDWFNQSPRVETAAGRINLTDNSFNNVGADNPRLLAINATLSLDDASKTISSIDLAWSGSGANTHTVIFGLSGDLAGIGHYSPIPLTDASFNQDVVVGAVESVPEPGTLALFGLGAAGLLALRRKK